VSALLQWCDAFTHGISSFKGIEFVCCPRSTDTRSRTNKEDGDIDYDDDDDDENQEEYEYEDESSSSQDSDEDEDDDEKQSREDFSTKKKKKGNKNESKTHSNSLFIFMLVASSLLILGFVFKKQLKKRWLMFRSATRRNEFIQANTTVGYGEEAHHVNSMQVNGYENPTYKLFENPNASHA
jgi:cobalamin biosynthesis protein CobT